MENNINRINAAIVALFLLFTAAAAVINLIEALAGTAKLAVWSWPLLYFGYLFLRIHFSRKEWAAILNKLETIWKSATTSTISFIARAASGLAAALYYLTHNTRTEP